MLDTAEYIHLAMHASKKGDAHAALNYLKEALAQEPENATARYLMAAEHAELGLYEKAIAGMEDVTRLAPGLETAEFQLGLLLLQTARPEEAFQAFGRLGNRSTDASLRLFAQAYQRLIREDVAQAIVCLKEGLNQCSNAHLKGDMERVLASLDDKAPAPSSPQDQKIDSATPAFMLGAYRDSIDSH